MSSGSQYNTASMEQEQMEVDPIKRQESAIKNKTIAFNHLNNLDKAINIACNVTTYYGCQPTLDLDADAKMTGAMATLNNVLKKKANGGDVSGLEIAKMEISTNNSCTIKDAMDQFQILNGSQDVKFDVVVPVVNMCTSFKAVKDEVRMGCNQLITKKGQKKIPVNISKYGLSAHHTPYLKLATITPERRTGLMKCVGPLAHMINLLEDKQYQEKTKRALKEQIKHLPMADAIISCCARNHANSIGSVLRAVGDVLLLTTDRSHQKQFLPWVSFKKIYCLPDGDDKVKFDLKRVAEEYDFSGRGSVVAYQRAALENYSWTSCSTNDAHAKQIFFHSVYGTHFEDLGVLQGLTATENWNPRSQLNDVFKKTGGKVFKFKPYSLVYASKLSSACGTKMINNMQPMVQCKPVFSGSRKRKFTEALQQIFKETGTGAYDDTPITLTRVLTDLRDEICKNKLNEDFGTTDWYHADSVTVETWGVKAPFIPKESGNYFYA